MTARPATRNRSDIAPEFRWDVSPIFADWAAWESALADMERKMTAFTLLKGTLAQGPSVLLEAYEAFDEIGKLQYLVFRYVQLQRDVDLRDQTMAARFQRVGVVFAQFDTATSWFTPELLQVPRATVEAWLAKTPALAPYRFPIVEAYRRQAHVLNEQGERLLSLAGQFSRTPGATFQELSTSDIKYPTITTSEGEEVTLSPANYSALLERARHQPDRASAASAHLGTYGATANTYAAIYNSVLQRDWFMAQARNFSSTLDAALDDNNIPRAVVETLVKTTREGTAPLQRYVRLRKRLLGLGEYHPYDAFLPIYRHEKTYPYEVARELALASIAPLGEAYASKYRRFVSGGRIDVYESEGKRPGAYQAGVYGVGPYLLLNHNDTLDSVFTLAHEAGHAMHTVLAHETQPFSTSDYTIFVAEVASITNERLLLEHLLTGAQDPKERFLLLEQAVDAIVGTFYTQVLFADFELKAHALVEAGQPVTAEVLNTIYSGLLKSYYGDVVTVDAFYRWTWARIPHFFNSPYYVFQYATCFASSAQLLQAMKTGSPQERAAATERYLNLLRAGGNDAPMEQLKKAGVDLTQSQTVAAVVAQMNALVTQMEHEAAAIEG